MTRARDRRKARARRRLAEWERARASFEPPPLCVELTAWAERFLQAHASFAEAMVRVVVEWQNGLRTKKARAETA